MSNLESSLRSAVVDHHPLSCSGFAALPDLMMPRRHGCETIHWVLRNQSRSEPFSIAFGPGPAVVVRALQAGARVALPKAIRARAAGTTGPTAPSRLPLQRAGEPRTDRKRTKMNDLLIPAILLKR